MKKVNFCYVIFFQVDANVDRSKIIPSAEMFDAPRGQCCFEYCVMSTDDSVQ